MNWVLLLVIAIFAVFGYTGWRRGVISTIVSLAAMIITIIVASMLAPVTVNSLKKNTTLFDRFQSAVYDTISGNAHFNDAIDSTVDDTVGEISGVTLPEDASTYSEYTDVIGSYVGQTVEKLGLPDSMSTQIENVVPENVNGLFADSVTGVKDAVIRVIAYQIATILFNIIAYAVIFLVVYIALRLVASALGVVGRLPGIKQVNQLAGLVLGLAEGLIVVWLFFAVVTFLAAEPWAAAILQNIGNSGILEFLYDHDFILKSVFESI